MAYKFRADRTLSRAFKDFSIGFKANPNTEDFSVVKNENAIKQSIRNLVSTGMYERPFQPNTGSRLREMLFEPYDVFLGEDLKEEIKNVVARFEPRVVLNDVRITPGDDDNTLDIEVDYTIVGETLVQTVDFLLERT
jgi:phage baseplate assembly protein W|tara:strand:- start:1601 stop:2011 length:411 start_codon:yes stop_codon:yes gene_type:complete